MHQAFLLFIMLLIDHGHTYLHSLEYTLPPILHPLTSDLSPVILNHPSFTWSAVVPQCQSGQHWKGETFTVAVSLQTILFNIYQKICLVFLN